MWASLVHEATWNMELPDVPYVAATQEELEVVSNLYPYRKVHTLKYFIDG
jgi:hypothetical protein